MTGFATPGQKHRSILGPDGSLSGLCSPRKKTATRSEPTHPSRRYLSRTTRRMGEGRKLDSERLHAGVAMATRRGITQSGQGCAMFPHSVLSGTPWCPSAPPQGPHVLIPGERYKLKKTVVRTHRVRGAVQTHRIKPSPSPDPAGR